MTNRGLKILVFYSISQKPKIYKGCFLKFIMVEVINQQEIIMQLSMLQQQAEKIEEQIKMINQQILEIEALREALDKLETSKDKEILASMGKGVFIKAEVKSKDVLVNVGNNIIVKKTPEETKQIISHQIGQLAEFKQQFMIQLQDTQMQLQDLVMSAQASQGQGHVHDENCEHEHE